MQLRLIRSVAKLLPEVKMNIQVSEVEYCKLLVNCEIENSEVLNKMDDVVKQFKSYKMPGFRPGKAPPQAIKMHFKKEIAETLRNQLANDAVQNALQENNIKPFGQPTFSFAELGIGFKCEFSIYKQPEFELKQYKEFEIPKPMDVYNTENLSQKMLEDLRNRFGTTVPFDENSFVQNGDGVILFHNATIDGNKIEKLSGDSSILNVGQINIPGFSENLLGMKNEEERSFELQMPENHPEYPNQVIKFDVRLIMGSKNEPAALDDELAKKVGMQDFNSLMEAIASTSAGRIKELNKEQIYTQISNRLVENHDFKIPDWIGLAEAKMNVKNSNKNFDDLPDEEKEKAIQMAEKNVKLSLILQKVRENEPDAQLSDEEVFKIARENLAKHSPNPDKVIEEIYNNGQLMFFFARIKDDYVIEFIEKTCKIIE